jgi:hypothetical protein
VNEFTLSATLNGYTVKSQFYAHCVGDTITPFIEQFLEAVRAIPLTRWQRFVLRVRGIKL